MNNWLVGVMMLGLFTSLYKTIRGPMEEKVKTPGEHAAIACIYWFGIAPPIVWFLLRYWEWIT